MALIGNNGCGKSTLLQIMAGKLQPSSGNVLRPDDLYYVPQHFGQYDEMSIAQALGIDRKQKALHEILNGNASIDHFNILDDDWNIEEKALAALNGWGLGNRSLSESMHTLSGGEKTRVFLAGLELQEPSAVLMDEPTNHLDNQGRNRLYEWVKKCRSTLIVVSHDRTLLNRLPETCELSRNALVCYGGNYEFYKQQKELQQNALQQQLNEKEKELRITIPESLDYTSVFDDIFARYLNRCELVQVKTTNMGSLFKLEYRIVFREEGEEKNMIDQLRCRNGNLEILCSRAQTGREEL